jgi:two-component system nitrogen regulation response regulator NtrX
VEVFLEDFSKRNRTPVKQMSTEALEMLSHYSWPGNVRELKNLVGRLVIMAEKPIIEAADIPEPYNPGPAAPDETLEDRLFSVDRLEAARDLFEAEFIRRRLSMHHNDPERTAEALGIDPPDLRRKIAALSIEV